MAIDRDGGTGQPASVDDTGVVCGVRDDEVVGGGKGRQHTEVRLVARGEQEGGGFTHEAGE